MHLHRRRARHLDAGIHLAYERRANFLPGESYPNPREDDSFKKYLGDPRFEAAIKDMGF